MTGCVDHVTGMKTHGFDGVRRSGDVLPLSVNSRRYDTHVQRDTAARWDATYQTLGVGGVSWFQSEPAISLQLNEATGVARDSAIVDVGGGASVLADHLVSRGFSDLSVLDVSAVALAEAQARLGPEASVTWIRKDLLSFKPSRRYTLWHDRAVFHFLVDESDRDEYRNVLMSSMALGGYVVMGTFAEDGPEQCSGLPVARYSESSLADMLGDRFLVEETRRESHRTPSGATQPFTWVAARLAS